MNLTVDEALAELRSIAEELEAMSEDDPDRDRLENRREQLRKAARRAADDARHPEALLRERDALERRLATLEGEKIKPSLIEQRSWLNDPSAYSHRINERLEASSSEERMAIEARLEELHELLDDADEDVPDGDADPDPDGGG